MPIDSQVRQNHEDEIVTEDVPALRVIEPDLWEQIQAELATAAAQPQAGWRDERAQLVKSPYRRKESPLRPSTTLVEWAWV